MKKQPPGIDDPITARARGPHPPRPGTALPPAFRALLALLAGASLLFLAGLGRLDLWAPDEPRYAAIAEEVRSGRHGLPGLALLHLNDAPYSQKPPLYFWLAAALGAPLGRVDELAARLPSALAAIACVAGTFWIGGLLRLAPAAAWLAAGLLATSFRFAFSARRAQLDVLLAAWELAAIAVYLLLELRRGGIEQAPKHPALLVGLHAALGAAALTKGPVGWLPLLVFAAHLAWEGRLTAFRCLVPAWSWLLSLGPLALWIATATALAPDGFARDAVGTNVFARFFAGSSHARPFYYYAYQVPLDFLPWSLLWPAALIALARGPRGFTSPGSTAAGPTPSAVRFLAVWILVPLAFFSLSAGKRGLYLLPIFPALALATSLAFLGLRGRTGDARLDPARVRPLALAIALVAVVELGAALFVLPRLDPEKSPRPIAQAIARHTGPAEAVGLYALRPLEGAIPYYGARRVRSLPDEPAARAFLAGGGRLILLRARDFERLRAPLELQVVERFRSGRRELILARGPDGAVPRASTEG